MNSSPPYYRIRSRRDTPANWTTVNPVLGLGEIGVELSADISIGDKIKIGNGIDVWSDLPYSGGGGGGSAAPTISGSRSIPVNISSAGGITPPGGYNQLIYLQGLGGNVTVTANPQVAAGVNDGELLELRGRNNAQFVKVTNGNGLSLNGDCFLFADTSLWLRWDTVNWVEVSRRDS